MQIRRLLSTIAIAAALMLPQILHAQEAENHFDKNNPYTQLIPQPEFNGNLVGEKAFVLDKNTIML